MRVLLVGKGAPERGGIPVFLESLLAGLADDVELELLNLATTGERQGGRLSRRNLARTLTDAIAVWRRAAGHDLVHIHSAAAPGVTLLRAGLFALAGRSRGSRVVVHVHGGLLAQWLQSSKRRLLAKTALAAASSVVTVSSDAEAALSGVVAPARLSRIDNGVDVDRFQPAPPGAPSTRAVPRILYVGLLTPRKGLLDLFAASTALLADGHPHELVLVGGLPDEGSAAEEAVREAAPPHAHLIGTRSHDEMPAVYRDADLFCLPSWWEAMPLSVLEAMATGVPVVATDVGEVRRLVLDGDTGYVVPPRDRAALATALARLIDDPDHRATLGAAGRRRAVEEFSMARTVAAIAEQYRRLSR